MFLASTILELDQSGDHEGGLKRPEDTRKGGDKSEC